MWSSFISLIRCLSGHGAHLSGRLNTVIMIVSGADRGVGEAGSKSYVFQINNFM